MPRNEMLTEQEQQDLKAALEQIEDLERLLKRRPVETFKALMHLHIPMELEIEIRGATYAVKLNEPD
jgi:phage-related protein